MGCGSSGPAPLPVQGPGPAPAFSWPGTYELIGSYPEGDRRAVMEVAKSGVSYTLKMIEGPPGTLVEMLVSGKEAIITWDMEGHLMIVNLVATGDSVHGTWLAGSSEGPIRGARRETGF
jgi:hypothetical protein